MTADQGQQLVNALETAIEITQGFAMREPDAGVKQRAYDMAARWQALLFDIDKTEMALKPDSGFG